MKGGRQDHRNGPHSKREGGLHTPASQKKSCVVPGARCAPVVKGAQARSTWYPLVIYLVCNFLKFLIEISCRWHCVLDIE